MALSANTKPHFTTIADFISSMGGKATKLFTDIVLLCDRLGLIGKNMFAIDGCKISSNASKEWSGRIEDFERKRKKMEEEVEKLLKRHKELDSQKEELKDQLEKEKQAIQNYKNKIKKFSNFLKENNERISSSGSVVQSNITDPESAKLKSTESGTKQGYNAIAAVDDKHQIIVDAIAIGTVNERDAVAPVINNVRNVFGKENIKDTKLTADAGFSSEAVLEYLENENVDAYIPDKGFRDRDPKLKGHEKYRDTSKNLFKNNDFEKIDNGNLLRCPAGNTLYKTGAPENKKGYILQRYKGRESKCPDCPLRDKCIHGNGKIKQVYFQTENKISALQKMKAKIDSVKGRFIYSKRMGCVEPVFAHICHTMKLKYFSLRSKLKVNAQWKLFATVHNMKKLFTFSPLFA